MEERNTKAEAREELKRLKAEAKAGRKSQVTISVPAPEGKALQMETAKT